MNNESVGAGRLLICLRRLFALRCPVLAGASGIGILRLWLLAFGSLNLTACDPVSCVVPPPTCRPTTNNNTTNMQWVILLSSFSDRVALLVAE